VAHLTVGAVTSWIRDISRCVSLAAAFFGLSLAGSQPAAAQTPASLPADLPASLPPSTITLDRMDSATRIGLQVGFDKLDAVTLDHGFVMRYEPYGQVMLPNGSVGIYGQIPFSHAFHLNGQDATGVGNFDIGAFALPTHSAGLIVRAGLVLPTASDGGSQQAANSIAVYERLTDLLLIAPNYTTLRLSVATVQERGALFFRGDLGFDLAVHKPNGGSAVFVRGNLAAGVRAGGVDLSAELVNIGALDGSVPGGIAGRFLHTAAIGLRTQGINQFQLGTVFPLDAGARGEIWILSAGYQRAMY
jgi:hypothetical protein